MSTKNNNPKGIILILLSLSFLPVVSLSTRYLRIAAVVVVVVFLGKKA